jgi:hypothetical protein
MGDGEFLAEVNRLSQEDGMVNRLYGIKRVNGFVFGKIIDKDDCGFPPEESMWWLPLYKLCSAHQNIIEKCLFLGWG